MSEALLKKEIEKLCDTVTISVPFNYTLTTEQTKLVTYPNESFDCAPLKEYVDKDSKFILVPANDSIVFETDAPIEGGNYVASLLVIDTSYKALLPCSFEMITDREDTKIKKVIEGGMPMGSHARMTIHYQISLLDEEVAGMTGKFSFRFVNDSGKPVKISLENNKFHHTKHPSAQVVGEPEIKNSVSVQKVAISTTGQSVKDSILKENGLALDSTAVIELNFEKQMADREVYRGLLSKVLEKLPTFVEVGSTKGNRVTYFTQELIACRRFFESATAKVMLRFGDDTYPVAIRNEIRELSAIQIVSICIELDNAAAERIRDTHWIANNVNGDTVKDKNDVVKMLNDIVFNREKSEFIKTHCYSMSAKEIVDALDGNFNSEGRDDVEVVAIPEEVINQYFA